MRSWKRHAIFLHRIDRGVPVVFVSGCRFYEFLVPGLDGVHIPLPVVTPLLARELALRADGSLDPHTARFSLAGLELLGLPEAARFLHHVYERADFHPVDILSQHVAVDRCAASLPPGLLDLPCVDLCLARVPASLREVSLLGVLAHLRLVLRRVGRPVCLVLDEVFGWLTSAETRSLLRYFLFPWVSPAVELLLVTRQRRKVPLDAATTVLTGGPYPSYLTRIFAPPAQRRAGWPLEDFHLQGDPDERDEACTPVPHAV